VVIFEGGFGENFSKKFLLMNNELLETFQVVLYL